MHHRVSRGSRVYVCVFTNVVAATAAAAAAAAAAAVVCCRETACLQSGGAAPNSPNADNPNLSLGNKMKSFFEDTAKKARIEQKAAAATTA